MKDRIESALNAFFAEEEGADARDAATAIPLEKAWVIDEPGGDLWLAVRAPEGSFEPVRTFNINCLRGLGLQEVLQEGLVIYATRPVTLGTIKTAVKALRTGFVSFLSSTRRSDRSPRIAITARNLNASDLKAFAEFLRRQKIENPTRRERASFLVQVMRAFARSRRASGSDVTAIDALCKTSQFKNLSQNAQSQTGSMRSQGREADKFLSHEALLAIHDAAIADVRLACPHRVVRFQS